MHMLKRQQTTMAEERLKRQQTMLAARNLKLQHQNVDLIEHRAMANMEDRLLVSKGGLWDPNVIIDFFIILAGVDGLVLPWQVRAWPLFLFPPPYAHGPITACSLYQPPDGRTCTDPGLGICADTKRGRHLVEGPTVV